MRFGANTSFGGFNAIDSIQISGEDRHEGEDQRRQSVRTGVQDARGMLDLAARERDLTHR